VKLNNTLQEGWHATPDSTEQWSHCGVAPLYITYQGLVGLRPLAPGCTRVEIRPQLADLEELDVIAHLVPGPVRFTAQGRSGGRFVAVELPPNCEGEAVLRGEESVELTPLAGEAPPGHRRYRLPAGSRSVFALKFS
jgi:alpha-L-rhamnosidase